MKDTLARSDGPAAASTGRSASPATPGPKRTAIEIIYRQIRERVISGAFQPGERLHVDNLRTEFGVSTSTMREAISRLLVDALVVSEQQRGFRVAPLSRKDFRNITDARKLIEGQAVRISLTNRTEEWEAGLLGAFHRLAKVEERILGQGERELVDDWDARNAAFHDCLVANCHNDWLIRFRHTLHQHSRRYHRRILGDQLSVRDVRIEHRRIFDAAMSGDTERCVAEVESHIEKSFSELISLNALA